MGTLVRFLRTRGLQRGVFGSSRAWLGVWVALTLARQVNKRLGREPELVDRIVLHRGQAVEVRDTGVRWKDDPEATTKPRKRGRRPR
jgi:hypothetical protein